MAILKNLNLAGDIKGEGRPGAQPPAGKGVGAVPSPLAGMLAGMGLGFPPAAAPAVEPPTRGITEGLKPGLKPGLTVRPPVVKFPPLAFLPKTATQLARGAIQQLSGASPAVLTEAINTIRNKNIAASGLMNYLERRVRVGEVLNEVAKDWSPETKQDFAAAFQADPNKLEVMDHIVAIAILNDPELEEELSIENTPEVTEKDLIEDRRVVWQYPPPGTILEPPYLILVAVEHQEVAKAEEVVQSILGELVDHQGYKIPRSAAQKLR
jgi:hypothetical protein